MTKRQLLIQVVIEGLCVIGLIAGILTLPGHNYYEGIIYALGAFVLASWAELRRRRQ
jgi:hypothetical protein